MTPIYGLISTLALPVLALAAWRRGGRVELAERLARAPAAVPGALWVHGASLGELAAARPLVQALVAARPGLRLLVTANSAAGRAAVAGWGMEGVTAAYAPLDDPWALQRFLARHDPAGLVILENELWPGRIAALAARGRPVVVAGARLSARSAARWARLPGLIRPLLARLAGVAPQDADSADRLRALGLPAHRLWPAVALKAAAVPAAVPALPFAPPAARDRTLLAASTHEGEDAAILQAFIAARAAGRFDHLILAPRHPARGDAVAALVAAAGLTLARRSQGQVPGPGTPLHLADTLGEMPAWYAMAGATLVGGSLVPRGGHTPWEPAAQGSAILHGPHVENFAGPYAALAAAGGAVAVTAETLAAVLMRLDGAEQARLADAARSALAGGTDVPGLAARVLSAVYPSG